MTTQNIEYQFEFEDGASASYEVKLNFPSLISQKQEIDSIPNWVELECEKCSNCPLDSSNYPVCPVAQDLIPVLKFCTGRASHDPVIVRVEKSDSSILANVTMEKGISSLLGLIMATSGCPHMTYFKPMARFHLPFANEEESLYRVASMHLLRQYFCKQNRNKDEDFDGLEEIFENVQTVNRGIANRMRLASTDDAAVNAVVLLDLLAMSVPYSIDESLQELKYLFE